MSSLNKVMLIGRLGKDPEVRYTAGGTAISNASLATSFKKGDTEETEWHRLVFWDKLATTVGEYLHKGSLIYVEGRLRTRKWTDNNGHDRWSTEVLVDRMQMLGSRPQEADAPRTPVKSHDSESPLDDDIAF